MPICGKLPCKVHLLNPRKLWKQRREIRKTWEERALSCCSLQAVRSGTGNGGPLCRCGPGDYVRECLTMLPPCPVSWNTVRSVLCVVVATRCLALLPASAWCLFQVQFPIFSVRGRWTSQSRARLLVHYASSVSETTVNRCSREAEGGNYCWASSSNDAEDIQQRQTEYRHVQPALYSTCFPSFYKEWLPIFRRWTRQRFGKHSTPWDWFTEKPGPSLKLLWWELVTWCHSCLRDICDVWSQGSQSCTCTKSAQVNAHNTKCIGSAGLCWLHQTP